MTGDLQRPMLERPRVLRGSRKPEVVNVSVHGLWLWSHGRELFLSYEDFPWFKDQTIKAVVNVKELSPGHYYWPDLDIDLTDEIIEHPERFPCVFRGE